MATVDTFVECLRLTVARPAPQSVLKRAISFPALLAAAIVGALFVPLRLFIIDPDVWWHIKVGQTILDTHRFPTADTYSFTAHGTPWIDYEWLGDILLAAAQRAFGLRGLMLLDLVLASAILLALYGLATLRSGNSKAALVTVTVLSPLAYVSFSLRPQMLGYLFLILTLIILERFRQGRPRSLWLLPPLFLVWVNTHGTFAFGLFAVGVYFASGLVQIKWGSLQSRLWTLGERLRLESVALLTLLALTLTPYGTRLMLYPLDMAFSQPINVANIQEWQPMMFGEFFGKIFLLLFIAFLVAQITLRLPWRLDELALFLAGVVLVCLHIRFFLVFVPFTAPLLATLLARWIPAYEPAKDKHALNALLMAGVLAGLVWFFPSESGLKGITVEKWPVQAVDYLKQHPVPGPMYNNYGYGGYLIWQLDGQNKVFLDGRADIYERVGVLSDYLDISRIQLNALLLLRAYNVQSCLIQRDEVLATLLAASPEWQRVYGDTSSVLFVRESGAGPTEQGAQPRAQ